MTNYFSFIILFVIVSQVLSAPLVNDNKLEEELQEIHGVKSYEPSTAVHHRTIRQTSQGKKNSSKPKGGKPAVSSQQPEAPPSQERSNQEQEQQRAINEQLDQQRSINQQENQLNADSNQELLGTAQEQALRNAVQQQALLGATQEQRLIGNADLMNLERSAQDMLSQETNQQARHFSHPLLDKVKGLKGGYGGEYSLVPEYQSISYQEPIIQPVVHQKPVLFHQEVIKPIVHEIVKPMPVFHETVKPVFHEVVKTLPVVKEVIKPVPVVHEILKPYTVPVVHPVQFHQQPTQISVPMQWSCQLVRGQGGPAVSGIQNGYGSYGSSSSSGFSGLSGYGSYSSYAPASYASALSGYSQGGSYGLGQGASLGTYSLPIKTLPPKILGGHQHGLYKSNSEARDSMQDAIEDVIQREELNYSSMGPSSEMEPSEMTMKSKENPQQFAKVMDSMNQQRNNLRNNMPSNMMDFQQAPFQGLSQGPQSLTNEQMMKLKMAMERNSQEPSWEQMRNVQQMPMQQFPLNARTVQIPMIQMRTEAMEQMPFTQMRSAMDQPMSWEQQRSAELDQQIALEQMRATKEHQMRMSLEQQMLIDQMRSAQMNQDAWGSRSAQSAAEQMRSADLNMQNIPDMRSAMEQMRSADLDSQQMRSASEMSMQENELEQQQQS